MRRALLRCSGCLVIMMALLQLDLLTSTTSWAMPQQQGADRKVYLPLVRTKTEGVAYKVYVPHVYAPLAPPTVFGMEMTRILPTRDLAGVSQLQPSFIRLQNFQWEFVQPAEGGEFKWDATPVRVLERQMIHAYNEGMRVVLIIRGTPPWASTIASDCAPIRPDDYPDFGRFMAAVIERYSKPPYNVLYYEIGNEVDVDPSLVAPNSGFGCWGDKDDALYGGGAYGEMLKVMYPMAKAANPAAQIMIGGLLLDRPYDPANEADTRSARFMEGVYAVGAGNSYDILSYHYYTYFFDHANTPFGLTNRLTDGAFDWKAAYLRDLMTRYGAPQKPLYNSEGGLLCFTTDLAACFDAQADSIGRIYARTIKDGVVGLSWYLYDSDSFRFTALIDPTNYTVKRPAYFAYKHARMMLGGVQFVDELTGQAAGVTGWRFWNGRSHVTIVWSDTPGLTASVPVTPGAAVQCTDRAGNPIACVNNNGAVTIPALRSPIYVVSP